MLSKRPAVYVLGDYVISTSTPEDSFRSCPVEVLFWYYESSCSPNLPEATPSGCGNECSPLRGSLLRLPRSRILQAGTLISTIIPNDKRERNVSHERQS